MKKISSSKVQDFEIKHANLIRKYSPESMVLLKNNHVLPLNEVKTIALYGNGARNTIKGGTGSGDVNVRHFTTIEEGIENAGLTINSKDWLDQYTNFKRHYDDDFYTKLRTKAKKAGKNPFLMMMGKAPLEPDYDISINTNEKADAAIYVLARISGEGADRKIASGDLKLTKTEKHDILTLSKNYQKFVLILNVGGMVELEEIKDRIPAILLVSQLGMETGNAVADVLLGKAYPSGKLAMTWAPIENYASTKNFNKLDDVRYKEGIYVGYRYFDSFNIKPTYEFGYGLGYTKFKINPKLVDVNEKELSMKAEVKNTGCFSGKEVIEVYVSKPNDKIVQTYQTLIGYQKTNELAAGQSETIEFTLPTSELASYSTKDAQYKLFAGDYYLRVGNSSHNTHIVAKINIDKDVVLSQLQNLGGKTDFTDIKPNVPPYSYLAETKEKKNAPVIKLLAENFKTQEVDYEEEKVGKIESTEKYTWNDVLNKKINVFDFVKSLSVEQASYLLTGNYDFDQIGGSDSVIGSASQTIAGAAGETTHHLKDLNVPILIMADGPAGIRLSPIYTITKDGEVKSLSSSFKEGLDTDKGKNKNSDQVKYYQYCSAIPIGTAIAQSWNNKVAEIYGDIIGQEMEIFGIDIWLAPALNIQRSPLDGRDFEYYSEDPLVSGLNAAYITKGVQKHLGKTTTIKHFAANNQETNRMFANSMINERALREIYLHNFEIAVKLGKPHAVMSSYNLINGVHAANNKDTLTKILRNEWGFNGFVMTDWLTTASFIPNEGTKYSHSSPTKCIISGNDMIMPGLKSDTQDILNSYKKGKITREQINRAAKHILNVIYELSLR